MTRDDGRSTRISCITAGCGGRYRVVKADAEVDDELVCPLCGDGWARPTWTVLGQLVRTRAGGR